MKIHKKHIVGGVAVIAAAALLWGHTSTTPQVSTMSPTPIVATQGCTSINGLPDPKCTPGVAAITDASVICAAGYTTKSVRPSVSYTNNLKVQQIAQYGYTDTSTKDYEEDHLIPLEIGGSPTDPKNLWPELWNGPLGAHVKDLTENRCHKEVCGGQISITQAQTEIATDWQTACK